MKVVELLPSHEAAIDTPQLSEKSIRALQLALHEALQLGHTHIGTEHILLGLIRDGDNGAEALLSSLGANLGRVRQEVIQLLDGYQSAVPSPSNEPWCPQCRGAVGEFARYRTMAISSGVEDLEQSPLVLEVVYCANCGVTLHMSR